MKRIDSCEAISIAKTSYATRAATALCLASALIALVLSMAVTPAYGLQREIIASTFSSGDDTTTPEVTKLEIANANATVQRPGVAKIRVHFVEEETGVTSISVGITPYTQAQGSDWMKTVTRTVKFSEPRYTGSAVVEIPLTGNSPTGTWDITEYSIADAAGNTPGIQYAGYLDELYMDPSRRGFYYMFGGEVFETPTICVEDEFEYAFTNGLNNPKLLKNIGALKDGEAAHIMVNGNGILPAAAFDAIRGRDVTLVCYSSAYQWIFRGKDVKKASKDVNLKIKVKSVKKAALGTSRNAVALEFASNGVLPGKAEVRLKSDYLYSLRKIKGSLKLFYDAGSTYKRESTSFDLVFDGTDKWCYVDISHNSRFIIATQDLKGLEVGKKAKAGGCTYKVTSNAKSTVTLTNAPKTKASVTLPATVKINKKKYYVTGISQNAFKGTKAKTLVVKSKKLTKKSVAKCLKGSCKIKTVKVSAGSKKANKTYVKKYKKYFTKANCGRSVLVK